MSETVYIKTDKNIEVSKRMVLIGDVADVYCNDKKIENDIKHICLIILDEVGVNKIKKKRVCLSFMDIVKAVAKKYPDADVNNLGENEETFKVSAGIINSICGCIYICREHVRNYGIQQ